MEILGPLRRLLTGPDRPRPPAPSRRRHWIRLYGAPLGLLALVGIGFTDAQYQLANRGVPEPVAGAMAVLILLPVLMTVAGRPLLAWRVQYPMLFLGALGGTGEAWPWSPVHIMAALVVFAGLTWRADSGVIAWATVLTVVPVFVFAARGNAWGVAMLLLAIALAGDVVGRRRRLAEQAELTELEKARRAVLEERARIAREMHDVVAHHMSMIAVQAETAPYRVTGLPDPAQAEFTSIATAARAALTDMRRLLGVLRADTEDAPLAPQPGLAELPALVETACRAGVAVTLTGPGEAPDVPEATGLAAYRIVQEALANAARHAPGGPVDVLVRVTPEDLVVDVRNGPADTAHLRTAGLPAAAGRGHGLAGMRERAELLGGSLDAGPRDDGGYAVVARLPRTAEDT